MILSSTGQTPPEAPRAIGAFSYAGNIARDRQSVRAYTYINFQNFFGQNAKDYSFVSLTRTTITTLLETLF